MKAISCALLLCLGAVLAGCGQKGPLYLPGDAPASQTQGPPGVDKEHADDTAPGSEHTDSAAPDDAR